MTVPAASAAWRPAAVLGGLGLALAAWFGPTFALLVRLWHQDPNYSHGYLVLPISLLLAWRIYRRVGPPHGGEWGLGLLGVGLGLLLQAAAIVVRWPPLSYLALLCVLRGLLVAAGGRRWAAAFNFPLLFLFFMFPLPVVWTSYLSLWLQDFVARVSETVLSLFVICHRVGHTIRIAGVDRSLVVAEECSGIGQGIAFVAFAALLGHLLERRWWQRLVLLLAALPVAVAANTLRVILMNLGAVWFGTNWLGGVLHDAPAMFSLPVGILIFLAFDHVLGTLGRPAASVMGPLPAGRTPPLPGLGFMLGVLTAGAAGLWGLKAHIQVAGELSFPPLRESLDAVPLQVTDPHSGEVLWQGRDLTEAREEWRKKIDFADDLLLRVYHRREGGWARVYMVHSRVGEDRKHHPEICIRDVSGAPEDIAFRAQVPLRPDGSAAAQRFRFWVGSSRSWVVYYWHYAAQPQPAAELSRLQALHQRIGVMPPSVTVQVNVSGEDAATLQAVERELLPALDAAMRQRVLPPGSICGCDRIPIGLAR